MAPGANRSAQFGVQRLDGIGGVEQPSDLEALAQGLKTEPAPWADKNGKLIDWYAGKQWDSDIGDAKKALADYQVSFRNVLDNTSSGPNTSLYNLRNFPTLYLIDPKGVIAIKNGSLDAMVAQIVAALGTTK